MSEKGKTSLVQSVEKALSMVDMLAAENREMSLTEISARMGWPKSTAHGLLATLREYGYIDQSPITGHYRLGLRLFELGNHVARSWDIRTVAMPVMRKLNSLLGEMVQLATDTDGEVLYLDKLDSTRMMRIVSDIGMRLPMHCSGLGKVLLAHKKPSEIKWIVGQKGLPAMTKHTITTMAQLEKELALTRERGYGIDDREIMDSLRCVAAPIYDSDGHVRYAVSVSGFANSITGDRLDTVIREVCAAASEISFSMGYRAAAV